NCKKGLGYENYNVVSPPYTGNFMPLKLDLSFTGLYEFAIKPIVENCDAKTSETKPKDVRKNNDAPIIKEYVSDDEEKEVNQPKIKQKIVKLSIPKIEFVKPKQPKKKARKTIKHIELPRQNTNRPRGNQRKWNNMMSQRLGSHGGNDPGDHTCPGNPRQDLQDKGVIDSGCSRHITRNMSYLTNYKEIDGGYVAFGGNPEGGKNTGKDQQLKVIRCDNGTEFKNRKMNQFYEMKCIMRQYSVARTPQQNGVAERRNMTLIEAARTMLSDTKLATTFWAEAVNTGCYVQNRVFVVKPHNKTPYELFHGITLALSFMRPFGCPVTILNTKDHLGKFDGTKACDDAGKARMETVPGKDYILLPLWTSDPLISQESKSSQDDGFQPSSDSGKKVDEDPSKGSECKDQEKKDNVNSTNNVNTASTNKVNAISSNTNNELPFDPEMSALEDISTFNFSSNHEDDDEMADMNNSDTTIQVSPTSTTRIHKDHHIDQVIEDLHSTTQTSNMSKNLEGHGFVTTIHPRPNHKVLQNSLFACFLSQEEPKKAIGTKWVFQNKKDKRGIMIRNKARLVTQGHTQEERINYDEVFAVVARIEAIRLFLSYTSLKDFVVYQMDVKSAFLYGKIEDEVYVCQPPGFEDPDFLDNVGKIDKTLFIRRHKDDILLVQVYVDDINFGLTKKEDEDGKEVDLYMYRSMIGSLMLTSSRPDIMFVVCACARYQVNPKVSHLHVVKRIFRYLKGQPKFGLWYPKDSPFDLVAYTDNDYARASLDRKSTTGEAEYVAASNCCGQLLWIQNQLLDYGVATTATSLDAEEDRGNIFKTQSKATPNEPSSQRTRSGGGLRFQETIGDTVAQTRKDNLKLNELMKLCTKLQQRVLDLETKKTTQALEINSLKRRVKKLERRKRLRTHGLKRLYKVGLSARVESSKDEGMGEKDASKHRRIDDIDANKDIYLVNVHNDKYMFGINDLDGDEVIVESVDVAKQVKEKMEYDKESAELKQCLEVILDDGDDVTVDATPLSSNKMLKNFDREDLEVLLRLVKDGFEKIAPVDYMDNLLLHTLKTLFEHHVEDNVWKNLQGLVKIYPLTNRTLRQMFNDVKLQVDYECEMAFELLRLVKK
nr:hypothetical protein [Tanacetum cinerariifolium]